MVLQMWLEERESREIVAHVIEKHGSKLSRVDFADAICLAFEDISGFEGIDEDRALYWVNSLWPFYLSRKPLDDL